MSNFGSKSEANFYHSHCNLEPIHNLFLKNPKTRTDLLFSASNGDTFRAQADFYHRPTKTLIEYKTEYLNSLPTPIDCLVADSEYRGRNKYLRIRDCSWSNSLVKHLIVQKTLKQHRINYLMVFDCECNISKRRLNSYTKAGLQWCLEQDFIYYCENTFLESDWD
ncbi:hypothetical protein BBM68_08685 [Vibrio parahaemolyticus]|nr:hypothetical protein BBM67_19450 [Vibrio parahaemolyticus]OEA76259.1 hypothetical protein BBM68_08685 [Vibrio parahaemolyticus]